MEDLVMKCVMAKFVPWFMIPEQKEHRAAFANDLIQTTANEPDFLKDITLKGTMHIIVLCILFLVSCIFFKNASIFQIIWLYPFWTDFLCVCACMRVCVHVCA